MVCDATNYYCGLQGFNATLTEPVDTLGRGGQIKEMELKVHPDLKEPLKKLSEDPKTTIIVLSGSGRAVLDKVFFRKFYLFFNVRNHLLL